MKTVLISIQPNWVEKILNYIKQWEIRKTRPKCDEPFRVLIYCTKGKECIYTGKTFTYTQEVVGEFICDRIDEYQTEFDKDDNTFQRIYHMIKGEDYNEYGEEYLITDYDNDDCEDWNNTLFKNSCVTIGELRKYLGYEDSKFYAWHISDLKIYDEPKELREFKKPELPLGLRYEDDRITRPPQDWFYVQGE